MRFRLGESPGEARPVCVSTLLRSLIEFRERDWKASGIRVQDLTSSEQTFVLGSHGQLEQAFLTLFVHAEQSLAEAPEKTITIRTSILGKRLVIEIAFTAPSDARAPQETAAVLGLQAPAASKRYVRALARLRQIMEATARDSP